MIYALLILAVIIAFAVLVYNSLIGLRNKADEAWSDIDTQLKRRYDLIPNLVETVKGYASHEAQTLEKVVQARNMAMNAKSVHEKEQAENMLTGALKTIFALAENYPELKANENFTNLQNTLKEIEEHIQLSRRYYNATVRDFNTKLQVFPNNIIAGPLGFKAKEFFQADEKDRENVKVSFSKEEPPEPPPASPPPAPTPPETPQASENPPIASPAAPESQEPPKSITGDETSSTKSEPPAATPPTNS